MIIVYHRMKKGTRNKYFYMQELYGENYKTLLKDVKEGLNTWEDLPAHRLRIMMLILPNLRIQYNFNKNLGRFIFLLCFIFYIYLET